MRIKIEEIISLRSGFVLLSHHRQEESRETDQRKYRVARMEDYFDPKDSQAYFFQRANLDFDYSDFGF